MRDTWVTDISQLFDELGDIAPVSGTSLRFTEYLLSIISLISHPVPVPEERNVTCSRRPHKIRCKGLIEGHIDPNTKSIVWRCPICGDNGIITNWQGTLWDMSDAGDTAH